MLSIKKMVERIISNRVITGISVIVGIVALVITMATTKTGLIPDEDTGVLFRNYFFGTWYVASRNAEGN